MFRYLLITATILAIFSAAAGAADYPVYSLVRINTVSDSDLKIVESLPFDIASAGDDYVDAVVSRDRISMLDDAGLDYRIDIEDMTGFYQARLASEKLDGVGSMGGYRTLSEVYLAMDSIADENPSIVLSKWSIGQTLEGRDIFTMKISDNPDTDEDEPEIHYVGAIHAREVITPETLIHFMRYLTENYGVDPIATMLVDEREMFFTLVHNPDGYYHNEVIAPGGGGMWRKNRRDNGDGTFGVDLNRNYGYEWGFDDNGSSPFGWSEVYRGSGPFSEPATQVLSNFAMGRPFRVVVDLHSFSNVYLFPWGYSCSPTMENDLYMAVGNVAALANGYGVGFCCGINGYSGDWYYGEQTLKPQMYEFLIEIGNNSDGFWPPISRITPLVEENLHGLITMAKFAGDTLFLQPPAAPVLEPVGEVAELPLELNWSHDDDVNPAVGFNVWEYRNYTKFTDDLEYAASGFWQTDGFQHTSSRSHSGNYSYWSTACSTCDYVLVLADPVKIVEGDSLKVWMWYDMFDHLNYAYLEVLGEDQSWTSIPGNVTTDENPQGSNLGNGITGSSGGWILAVFDLSDYVGQEIQYRFRYISEFESEGIYVDDVYPLDIYEVINLLAENHPDTSFQITDIENGECYFEVYAVDNESQISPSSGLQYALINVEGEPTVPGDADGSGDVDIDDVVFLVTYIFAGGDPPDPEEAGDADCSGGIDIDDAVYIINYIFASGPAPCLQQ